MENVAVGVFFGTMSQLTGYRATPAATLGKPLRWSEKLAEFCGFLACSRKGLRHLLRHGATFNRLTATHSLPPYKGESVAARDSVLAKSLSTVSNLLLGAPLHCKRIGLARACESGMPGWAASSHASTSTGAARTIQGSLPRREHVDRRGSPAKTRLAPPQRLAGLLRLAPFPCCPGRSIQLGTKRE